jgi:ATP-dependent helicase/nuclease subunit A
MSTRPAQLTLIKAGAGAGKTHRIMQALTQWIADDYVAADKVLAVTYTRAAAKEMKGRVKEELLKLGLFDKAALVAQSNISTIHSFGTEIIKQFTYELGISPKPRQVNEAEQVQMLKQALEQVTEVTDLVINVRALGYGSGFGKGGFQTAADTIRQTMMTCIDRLRALGKDVSDQQYLLDSALNKLTNAYGFTSNGDALTRDLREAVRQLQKAYPSLDETPEKWRKNSASREFLTTVYSISADEPRLDNEWKLWAKLQTITAPSISSDKGDGPDSYLVLAVWHAADKLSDHPGPLAQQHDHLTALLNGALVALQQYQDLKRSTSLIDFGDMVGLANEIVSNSEHLAEVCQQYQCLIIDEFQDTNPLQFALLRHFQKQGLPTLIVGDLKQSIMGFQGSDRRLFNALLNNADASEQQELTSNWRSTAKLMTFINQMGTTLYGEEYQHLDPQVTFQSHSDLKPVQVLEFQKSKWGRDGKTKNKLRVSEEGQAALANHIKSLLVQGLTVVDKDTLQPRPMKASDIAVLAPKHKGLQDLAGYLHQVSLQTQIEAPGFLEMSSVDCLLNLLLVVADPNDRYSLLSAITSDIFTDDAAATLEDNLAVYLKQQNFTSDLTEQLSGLPNNLHARPLHGQLLEIVDALDFITMLSERGDGKEQRAATLKLIGLAQEFDQLNFVAANAEGIYGKSAPTFAAWLKQSKKDSKSTVDQQPDLHDTGNDAVVMSTWHSSKGREWPIVMVLSGHDANSPKLDSITMAYQSDEIEQMLPQSFVQILPKFADKTSNKRMLQQIQDEAQQTQLNLFYVALTRAREQVILPWFEGFQDESMLSILNPMFDAGKSQFEYGWKQVSSIDTEIENGVVAARVTVQPYWQNRAIPEVLAHTINPSLLAHGPDTTQAEEADTDDQAYESSDYHTALDLGYLDQRKQANETGTLVHRFYQVYLQRPELISKLVEQNAAYVGTEEAKLLEVHLKAFKLWVQRHCQNLIRWQSEVPILASNELGQTISGSIDLLVECVDGYWVIDHKTAKRRQPSEHWAQLKAYEQCLKLDKPVIGLVINWVRFGCVDYLQ